MISTIAPSMPHLKPPASLPEIEPKYAQTDAVITAMRDVVEKSPVAATSLSDLATRVKNDFKDEVTGLAQIPTLADDCHKAALQALSAGLLAGALDGVVAFAAQQAPPAPPSGTPAPAPAAPAAAPKNQISEDLQKLLDDIAAELAKDAQSAKDELKALGPKALQLSALAQKKSAPYLVDQSDLFTKSPKTPLLAFQAYEATLFALGYGIAVNDAAITILANQTPGQWP